jgi:carboxylesterase
VNIEAERDAARREGVCREENLPFLLEPAGSDSAGVLLVHGFTATPWEMRSLGAALAEAGFSVLAVRLPGHGTTPEDLAERRWEEWLAAVQTGHQLLAARCPRVYGVGMSTGGLLLLALAEAHPMGGLVLLSPYLRLRHPLAWASGFLRFLHPFQHHRLRPDLRPFYYDRRPVHGVFQLLRLLRRLRRSLGRLTLPILGIGSVGDQVIRVDSALELFRKLGSPQRELHLFGPEVPHVLITDENPRRQEVIRLVITFIADQEDLAGHAGRQKDPAPGPGSPRGCRSCR